MPSGVDRVERLVLDTSAYSQLRMGHRAVLELIAAAAAVVMPTIVLGELEAGFRRGSRAIDDRRLLADFLEEPFVSVFPVDRPVAQRYGESFALLRQAGTPIPTNDVWIAATTFACSGTLATFDQHFGRVAGLPVVFLN